MYIISQKKSDTANTALPFAMKELAEVAATLMMVESTAGYEMTKTMLRDTKMMPLARIGSNKGD